MRLKASQAEIRQALSNLPDIIAGTVPDVAGVGRSLRLRVANVLLSKIQQAFVVKARGGRGADNVEWKPLLPATIAQRRTTVKERRAAKVGGKRTRGLLTPTQDRQWRRLFATRKARMMMRGMSEGEASAAAARFAWAELKKSGAQTRIGLFGNRTVEIGRDTGRLFRSLAAGVEDRPAGAPEQVIDVDSGGVIVGTDVPYASHFHATRPLWPQTLPPEWWAAITSALARGIVRALAVYLGRGR
jgi:hypothetical protein